MQCTWNCNHLNCIDGISENIFLNKSSSHWACFEELRQNIVKDVHIDMFDEKSINKLNFLPKVRQFVDKWKLKSSKEQFSILYNIPNKILETVGVHAFGNGHVYWYSHWISVIVGSLLLLVMYTLCYFGVIGEFMIGIRSLCAIGITVPVIQSCLNIYFELCFLFSMFIVFASEYAVILQVYWCGSF